MSVSEGEFLWQDWEACCTAIDLSKVTRKNLEPFCGVIPGLPRQRSVGRLSLVSHYSAIGDTISCDAPYGAIGFRGKVFLRYPPLHGLSLDCDGHLLQKEVGCSSDSLRYHRKHSATGVLLHLSRNRGGISVGSLRDCPYHLFKDSSDKEACCIVFFTSYVKGSLTFWHLSFSIRETQGSASFRLG